MGGLACIMPKSIRKKTRLIPCNSWRLQAVLFQCGNQQLPIINSYFPVDPKSVSECSEDLVQTISEVQQILETVPFNTLFLCGDLNTDFLRKTAHVDAVRQFLLRCNLVTLWDSYYADFTYTHETCGEVTHHKIDHFLTQHKSLDSF